MFLEALNGIDLAVAEAADAYLRTGRKDPPPPCGNNHIFINAVAPDPDADPYAVEEHMRELMTRHQVPYGHNGLVPLFSSMYVVFLGCNDSLSTVGGSFITALHRCLVHS